MSTFESTFGRPREVLALAPGRVNLIGEHTDYNGGFVLPTILPHETRVELAPRDDEWVHVASTRFDDTPGQFRLGAESPVHGWIDYVQGMTYTLRRCGLTFPGFDALIDSDVPSGAGVSSSAALLIAVGRALCTRFDLVCDELWLAQMAQQAENGFVGAHVGIMDPMVVSLGRPGVALFIDTRTLEHEAIPIPPDIELVVIDSGTRHEHASGDYNLRRAECECAAESLGLAQLRDAGARGTGSGLWPQLERLPFPLNRRARHVVSENGRVLEAVASLRNGDVERLGELVSASHRSLRDDFEVSNLSIECLVGLLNLEPAVLGARLVGGGFGGAALAIARTGEGAALADRVAEHYARLTGLVPAILMPKSGGAGRPDASCRLGVGFAGEP